MLTIREITLKAAGWQGVLVSMPVPPAPAAVTAEAFALLDRLREVAESRWKLVPEVFLQTWKIAVDGNASRYEDNIAAWLPSIGIGVWPMRQPPRRMTRDLAMDRAASIISGEEPEAQAYHLSWISAGREAGEAATRTMLGRGMVLQLYAAAGFRGLQAAGKTEFLPLIADRAYRNYRFYVPVLDAATAAGATAEEMERWMCGTELYTRESAEDGGLLILSRRPLPDLLPGSPPPGGLTAAGAAAESGHRDRTT